MHGNTNVKTVNSVNGYSIRRSAKFKVEAEILLTEMKFPLSYYSLQTFVNCILQSPALVYAGKSKP